MAGGLLLVQNGLVQFQFIKPSHAEFPGIEFQQGSKYGYMFREKSLIEGSSPSSPTDLWGSGVTGKHTTLIRLKHKPIHSELSLLV